MARIPSLRHTITSLLFSCTLYTASLANGEDVQGVTEKEFNSIVGGNKLVLAAFISPASAPSNALLPEISQAAAILTAPLITVDCSIETSLCVKYDINAYPAIRLFRGLSNNTRYRGARTADGITSFMIKQQLHPITILDEDSIQSFKALDEKVFIAYLPPPDDEPSDEPSINRVIQEIYTAIAHENHHRFIFGLSFDPALAKQDGLPVPAIACYKMREGGNEALAGVEFTRAQVEEFVQAMSRDVIGEMTRRNMESYMQPSKLLTYIFYTTPTSRSTLRRSLARLAKKLQDYVTFVTIDAVEYGYIAASLELQPDLFPALVIHNMMNDQLFVYDQRSEIRTRDVGKLLVDVLQGKAQPGVQLMGGEEGGHDEL